MALKPKTPSELIDERKEALFKKLAEEPVEKPVVETTTKAQSRPVGNRGPKPEKVQSLPPAPDWETCPMAGKTHEEHDSKIREMVALLRTARDHINVLKESPRQENPGPDLSGLRARVSELEAIFKSGADRTARLLAERLFEVERQKEKLLDIIRERDTR